MLPAGIRQHRIVGLLGRFHRAYQELGSDPKAISVFSALTLVQPTLGIGITWATAVALGISVNLPVMLAAVPLAFIAARLPISLDGIGVYEGIFVGILALAGIRPADSLAITLVGRVVQIVAWLPWWLSFTLESRSVRTPKAA
jgi:uncharacterized membrane protein YbhN (UPF0104 family)